jgi:hypothetical protein
MGIFGCFARPFEADSWLSKKPDSSANPASGTPLSAARSWRIAQDLLVERI